VKTNSVFFHVYFEYGAGNMMCLQEVRLFRVKWDNFGIFLLPFKWCTKEH